MTDRTTTKLGTPNGKRVRESSVTADERQVREARREIASAKNWMVARDGLHSPGANANSAAGPERKRRVSPMDGANHRTALYAVRFTRRRVCEARNEAKIA